MIVKIKQEGNSREGKLSQTHCHFVMSALAIVSMWSPEVAATCHPQKSISLAAEIFMYPIQTKPYPFARTELYPGTFLVT